MSKAPDQKLREEIDGALQAVAQANGVSVDSLTSMDLQSMGYGYRIAAMENGGDRHMLAVADALDELSTLDKQALQYLENVAGTPLASA